MKLSLIIALLISFSLSSCVYKMDIDQGNAIDAKNLEQLKLGMSKKQVTFLLGKPAIKDLFHSNRWHYLITKKYDDQTQYTEKKMVLIFEGDILSQINGSL